MRTLVTALVVLLLVAVGGDLLAEKVATDRAESRLRDEGLRNPQVSVGGYPFLTQLIGRSFDHVTVTADAIDTASGRARDLDVAASSVSSRSGDRALVGSLRASGRITYAEVLARAKVRGVTLEPAGDGQVRVTGTIDLLGDQHTLAAVGRVKASDRAIDVTPSGFQLDGAPVRTPRLLDQLTRIYTLRYRLRDLPQGLTITDLAAADDGFHVVVTGTDVTVPAG